MCDRAEDVKRMLMDAERIGGRCAMRTIGTDRHIELTGCERWKEAVKRGYRFGEIGAIIKPWRRAGKGARQ